MLTIGQVASRTCLRASAIRYYEARGLLPAASRKGGRRIYDESILEKLAVIALAKVAGFDLEEIRGVLTDVGERQPAPAWRKLAQAKHVEIDRHIQRLRLSKKVLAKLLECTCASMEQCGQAFNAARAKHPPSAMLEPTAGRRLAAKRLRRRGSAANR
jgi:MerR family transcriptional regulator, redox-sensitive transcriptional activator SoxR